MTHGDGEYRLSCVLRAHEDDVRRICVCGDSGIATSSRDKTVKFWVPDPASITPGGQFPEGGIMSGWMDTLVLLCYLARGDIMEKMTTGLAIDDNGDIISLSIDRSYDTEVEKRPCC